MITSDAFLFHTNVHSQSWVRKKKIYRKVAGNKKGFGERYEKKIVD